MDLRENVHDDDVSFADRNILGETDWTEWHEVMKYSRQEEINPWRTMSADAYNLHNGISYSCPITEELNRSGIYVHYE